MNPLAFTFAALAVVVALSACDSSVMPTTSRAEFERADTNRDRVLDYREFELLKAVKSANGNAVNYGAQTGPHHKEFGLLDHNKDGVLSEGELGLY